MNPLARFLDWLLGAHCYGCGRRVFTRDLVRHYATECPEVHR